jgi:ribosomal protein S18 acetylase RimI-like enzyme
MTTKPIQRHDLPDLKAILDSCDLFPSAYLDDMIADYLDNPATEAHWFAVYSDDRPLSIGYCEPMPLTNGTYNLYAIGVHSGHQRQGIGSQMLTYLEQLLLTKGGRLLIIETSTSPDQIGACAFYAQQGYDLVATIPDFWDDGEGKVIFSKRLVA